MDEVPFKQRHRRIPPAMVDEVRQHLETLLASGIIKPSKSPWSSNIVLVRKKNGKLRLCVDYRMLNARTIKDSYALPRMEEIFDCLHGAKYFTTLDMKSGYHQVEVEDSHRERTAFTVGSLGFYEHRRLPFGLCNAPATYQRLMQDCLGDLNMTICLIYLDDLIIFSSSFEEHLERLDIILTRLKECNLKLAPEKCVFFQPEVKFLGHIVSDKGISTDPDKIEKVKKWPTPSNSDELRSFLAFAGYYRRFIKDFSKRTRPLSELLPPTSHKKGSKIKKTEWHWTTTHQKIFEEIKEMLCTAPVLAYPDFSLPFELHTDASTKALGAVLYQEQDGRKRVIAYASRALTKAERNYSAFKLEFLALKWAVTEKFADYLTMKHFMVLTDNNPLTYVLSTAKLDATGQRWASALGQFSFDITYRAGIKNADADGMSRYPYERLKEEDQIRIDDKVVKAICSYSDLALIETLPAASLNLLETFEDVGQTLALKDMREIRKAQIDDPLINTWRIAVLDSKIPKQFTSKADLTMKRQYQKFRMKRGILFRALQEDETEIEQLVVPESFKKEVLNGLHDDVGHPGIERTLRLMRERFYWPGMQADVEQHVKSCDRCLRRKDKSGQRAPLVNVHTSYPLELVCMDFLTLEPARGVGNILVITDHFTKFALAIPTKNQTAKTTAEAFYEHFIIHYGIPSRLHTDQGANFESHLIQELCTLMGMKKSHTTPYHPQSNSGPERFNRTLLEMLGTLENSQKENWKKYVSSLVYYYNCTPHEATKLSPFELMFGRKPKLPIDCIFESAQQEPLPSTTTSEYIKDLEERLELTRLLVLEKTDQSKAKQKKYYDRKAKIVEFKEGDKVLVRRKAFVGKHKIQDRYEDDIHTIVEQPRKDIPVFRVKSGDRVRTLHRNLLYLVEPASMENREDDSNLCKEQDEEGNKEDASNSIEDSFTESESSESESDSLVGQDVAAIARQDGDAHGSTEELPIQEIEDEAPYEVTIVEETDVEESSSEDDSDERMSSSSLNDRQDDIDTPETEETDIIEEAQDVVQETVNEEETERPVPQPRRSTRDRKPPDRWRDYYLMEMQQRKTDRRLIALKTIVNSGVLDSIDFDAARDIVKALLN